MATGSDVRDAAQARSTERVPLTVGMALLQRIFTSLLFSLCREL